MEQYFVTCLEKNGETTIKSNTGKDLGWPDFGRGIVYGYYETLEDVLTAIKENAEDIYDGIYEFLVVEKMQPGIHPLCIEEDRFWFRYDKQNGLYHRCEEVKNLHTCGFALG